MFKIAKFFLLILIFGTLALSGCEKSPAPTSTQPDSPISLPDSPLEMEMASPVEPPDTIPLEHRFSLDEPLVAGATVVSGTGPPGTAIIIVDVTAMAERLGSGFIKDDGTFVIDVNPPLINNRMIGIKAGIAVGETPPPNYLQDLLPYNGDNATDIPQLGLFLDTASVVPDS